jgi:hypothetical protein
MLTTKVVLMNRILSLCPLSFSLDPLAPGILEPFFKTIVNLQGGLIGVPPSLFPAKFLS